MAWLRLLRAALAPSIVWDWAAGILLAGLAWQPNFLLLLLILLCIYHGGMLGNDLADRAEDARHDRRRPLQTGAVRPAAAIAVLLLLWGLALGLAAWVVPAAWTATLTLIGAAAVYDFGGPVVRAAAGPALLAAARAGSLFFVPIVLLGADAAIAAAGLGAAAAYALYFLFVARLARREERGAPGSYGFILVAVSAAAPAIVLAQESFSWLAVGGCLLFAGWRLRSVWPDARRLGWGPDLVRMQVRIGLSGAPLVSAIALLARLDGAARTWALGGVITMLLVRALARALPPE